MSFLKSTSGFLQRLIRKRRNIFSVPLILKLLPLFTGVILFFVIHTLMLNMLQDFGSSKARQFKTAATSVFREIEYLSTSISHETDSSLLNDNQGSIMATTMQICENLRKYRLKSDFIKDFYIIIDDYPYILSSAGLYAYVSVDSILSMVGETQDTFKTAIEQNGAGWHIGGSGLIAPYFVMPISFSQESLHGEVLVELSLSAISKIFTEDSIALSCLFNDNYYISSSFGAGANDIDWHSSAAVSALLKNDVKCFFTYDESFSYMVAIPTSYYFAPSRTIALYFAIYLFALVLFEVFQAIRLNRQQSQYLSRIIDMLPKPSDGVSASGNFMVLVEQALAKYHDDEVRLYSVRRSNALRDILTGFTLPERVIEFTGIPACAAVYYVATFFADNFVGMSFDGKDNTNDPNIETIIFESALCAAFDQIGSVACCKIDSQITSVFAITTEPVEPFEDTIKQIIRNTTTLIESNYGLNIFAALSAPATNLADLHEAYKQAVDLHIFAQSIGLESNFLSYEDMLRGGELMSYDNFFMQLQVIVNTLRLEKFNLISDMVNTLLECTVVNNRDYTVVKSRLECISGVLSEAVLLFGDKSSDTTRRAALLRASSSVSDLKKTCVTIFSELAQITSVSDNIGAVDRACTYIRDHIDDSNMSVPLISEAVGLSTQHLSRLFRKQLNKTIAEYLNEYRVHIAKKLIIETGLPISKITTDVGYVSSDSFYRNFKKVEGLTPAEFRKIYKNN